MLHHRFLTGFWIFLRSWIWQGSKYDRVTQGFEQNAPLSIFDRILNMSLVLKWQDYRKLWVLCKLYSRDSWYSEYATGSQIDQDFECIRNLNVLDFHRILTAFLIYLGFWIYQSSEFVLETASR